MADSKTCAKCGEVKALSDFYAANGCVDGRAGACKLCYNAASKKYREDNTETIAAQRKESYAANPERFAAHRKKWSEANPDKKAACNKAYQSANPERRRACVKKSREANLDKYAAKAALSRAAKIKATPVWANSFFIGEIYSLAALRTKMTGFEWHVDHVIPLKGKHVCGLHVENNLNVIPGVENLLKSNSFMG